MAAERKTEKPRQPNWIAREEIALVQSYVERADLLEGEFSGCGGVGGVSSVTKDKAWTEVKEIVNSIAYVSRSLDQLKKKIAQIKCSALKKNRSNLHQTGGGRGQLMSEAESLYLRFLKDRNSSTIEGISCGTDLGFEIPSTSSRTAKDLSPLESEDSEEHPDIACGSNDIFHLMERLEKEKEKVEPPKKKCYPKKRKNNDEESSLYSSFLSESIKVMKLKQRKLELEIKKLENEQ